MATDIPKSLNINVDRSIIDGIANELGGLELVIKLGGDVDATLFDFMRHGDVAKTITLSYGGRVLEEGHGIPGISPPEAHEAIAAVLHTVLRDSLVPTPTSAFAMIELTYMIAANMISESPSVLILTDTARVNHVRDGAWDARTSCALSSLTSQRWLVEKGAERAMGLAFDALFFSTPKRLAEDYAKGCAPERDAYLYLEDLDTWYADRVNDCVREAANERFGRGLVPLRDDEAYVDIDDDDDDGGIFAFPDLDLPPGRPGGGIALSPSSRRAEEHIRDQRRVESLCELVATAERVLSRKQRSALVTKLFSPKLNGARAAMMLICREAVREVPHEIRDDDELAMLVGSPTASAAQRNYNHGRAKVLDYARDADQRKEWCVILDALLPRRSRGADGSGSARP